MKNQKAGQSLRLIFHPALCFCGGESDSHLLLRLTILSIFCDLWQCILSCVSSRSGFQILSEDKTVDRQSDGRNMEKSEDFEKQFCVCARASVFKCALEVPFLLGYLSLHM